MAEYSYANTPKVNKQVKDTLVNKIIPASFAAPINKALAHYPELKNTKITWRIKHAYTPLTTRPSFASLFKAKSKRSYIITISDKTIDTLEHLLYKHLTYDEQVGIMGHELGHVVDFSNKNMLQSARSAIGHLSSKYIDRMEYHTDMICIQHGLGKQLEEYSTYVRTKMHVHDWRGVDNVYHNDQTHERYMNPETIEKLMHSGH
ncbi:hypothetical protein FRZ67_04410 [Panacibacter ginsenosidivorans]|uniref:Uncharacterized protein n=1 Tax=Panacibacter ginsenosidivorans TaxID=1813871 RepID=A0A5B8V5B6_9BACT|nr:hypothetical protein [Panacibacter ginsenosidivorans]QEC66574.1 hypothetical protein FRZ67_04410 [Panacibacter ginsenosidivorans]